MHRKAFLIAATLLAAFPAVACANAGTPLMWATMLHLVFGNAIIGIGEGLLLALLFRKSALVCMAVMILANYFSAWLGGVYLLSHITGALELDLYNAWRWLWYLVGIAFLITLVLEWPFVALCLRKTDGWLWKSLVGLLVIQSASYLLLFGWYWSASRKSLYTEMSIVPLAEMNLPDDVALYYIAADDGHVYALDIATGRRERIGELDAFGKYDRLYARDEANDKGKWTLMAELANAAPWNTSTKIVRRDMPSVTPRSKRGERYPSNGEYPNVGEVPRLDAMDDSDWQFEQGWYSAEGLRAVNSKDDRSVRLAFETPMIDWFIYAPVQLPGDLAVFQLGPHQICVVDPNERKVALLVKGRGPVVSTSIR